MGLLHAFVNWGIRIIDNTDTDVRRIGQRFGFTPLSWRQVVMANPTKDGIAWRVPDPDVRTASSFANTQGVLVSENEMVMLLNNGKFETGERGVLLSPGLYDVSHLRVRDQIARRTVMEFQSARRELGDAAQELLQPIFNRWGLEFIGLTVENQNIPGQFRQAAAGRTIVTMEKEAQLEGAKADVTLAQLEAQRAYFTAQIEVARLRAIGQANVEIMQSQQSIGVDPLDIKRIEAIDALALNPGENALIDNRPQCRQFLPPRLQGLSYPIPRLRLRCRRAIPIVDRLTPMP